MTLPTATIKKGERTTCCGECRMLLPAERPVFHPHIYCMLVKAGVRDPEHYMRATFPLLAERFGPVPGVVPHCAGRLAVAHERTPMVLHGSCWRCPECGEEWEA